MTDASVGMDEAAFWRLVDASVQQPLDMGAACAALEGALMKLSASEVAAFCRQFDERMDDACRWDLWGVAYLVNGGCSDDGFMDFRAGLVALGEARWRSLMDDPEAIMDLSPEDREALFEEGFGYCGIKAHEVVAGGPPAPGGEGASEPEGDEWEESREALMARFPRVWAEYGWEAEPVSPPPSVPAPKKPWWRFW